MSRTFKCVLFDLDGTLVHTGGAGNRALDRAFLESFRLDGALRGIDPSGKTDPAIVREVFRARLERDCAPAEMEAVQELYLRYLPDECARSPGYREIAGAAELLERLEREGVSLGLGTGNLERGARLKLERAGFNRFFAYGGYGSDAEDRAELLRIGFQRACRHAGRSLDPRQVFVVGDTERDIRAARRAGFHVIAAGTGPLSAGDLRSFSPDAVLDHFEDGDHFLHLLELIPRAPRADSGEPRPQPA